MLETLSIKNFIIVDYLELNFQKGFTALTGETGAGKSILIDALSICLGQKANSSFIKKGKKKTDISAIFNIDMNQEVKLWLQDNDYEHDESLIIRRTIDTNGKSKAFINGTAVPINQLKLVTNKLVDIYSQNTHHSLLNSSTQRQILDSFAQSKTLAFEVSEAYFFWSNLYKEHEKYLENKSIYINELEDLEQKYKEFKELDFSDNHWDEIQKQHKLINSSSELIHGIQSCIDYLDNNENNSINGQLNNLKSNLLMLCKLDNNLTEKLDIIENSSLELSELSRDLNHYLSSMEINEGDRKKIEKKIESTFNFLRKYRISSDELFDLSKKWEERINTLNLLVNEKDKNDSLENAKENYDNLSSLLSKNREVAAKDLANKITNRLEELSFKNAKFKINLLNNEPSMHGNEQIEFLIATHLGADLMPIKRVASGGELSRISLAIRVSSMNQADIPVMVFDEVDVGIGGGVAEIVGSLLKSLGQLKNRQLFVVTHLAQVAAQSDHHFRVLKKLDAKEINSEIELLSSEERINEVARMIGGKEITLTALEHAKEILG